MIESLFYGAYYAYLRGDLQDARMYYELLSQEFKEARDPEALEEIQLRQLKDVRQALRTGVVADKVWVPEESSRNSSEQKTSLKQTELVKKIHYEGLEDLRELLGSPAADLYNIEHPCGEYGRVDMVYTGGAVVYPIEVKRHRGMHDLVGQIRKYELHFRLRLHLKRYKEVQPVTVCGSYEGHTLSELKRYGVVPLIFLEDSKGFRIRGL